MTFIDVTCMSDRSEEVIIETFPRRNDTPFFTTRSYSPELDADGGVR